MNTAEDDVMFEEAAFPCQDRGDGRSAAGMTLRDYFAARAMQGLLATMDGSFSHARCQTIATASYLIASAMMLEARRK